jgi:hypothetical protein
VTGRLLKNVACNVTPGRIAGVACVIDAPWIREPAFANKVRDLDDRAGQVWPMRRRPYLVVNNPDLLAINSQLQHRSDEVAAKGARQPSCSQDDVFTHGCSNELFPFELGSTVGADRRYRIGLLVRCILRTVEDVVG